MAGPCVNDSPTVTLTVEDDDSLTADAALSTIGYNGLTEQTDGLWAPARAPVVASLPTGVADGTEILFDTVQTGVYWQLRYVASDGLWVPVGEQPPLYDRIDTSESRTTNTYAALATAGPQVTLPALPGDYLVEWGATVGSSADSSVAGAGIQFGATAATDAFAVTTGNTNLASLARAKVKSGLVGGELVRMMYRGDGSGVCDFSDRWLLIRPRFVVGT
jgi:hypothetical protein